MDSKEAMEYLSKNLGTAVSMFDLRVECSCTTLNTLRVMGRELSAPFNEEYKTLHLEYEGKVLAITAINNLMVVAVERNWY